MSIYQLIIRLSLAAIIGGLIGAERERYNRPAGLRTHILVTVGSTLVMLVSISGFGNTGDPARLAAQVVSGIGFLGAGTIFKDSSTVRGLTTAAGLWVCAGLGLAIGVGMYFASIICTIIVILSLTMLNQLERNLVYKDIVYIHFKAVDTGNIIQQLQDRLRSINAEIVEVDIKNNKDILEEADDNMINLKTKIKVDRKLGFDVLNEIMSDMDNLYSISYSKENARKNPYKNKL